MRVLCINDAGWEGRIRFLFFKWIKKDTHGPEYMEECVVDSELVGEFGPSYKLRGYGGDDYTKSEFIPLSDIDGVEVLKNKEDEYA